MMPATNNMPAALMYCIRATAWYYDIDNVIIDLSPSGGVLNMLTVLSSTSLVVPVNASGFSLQSLSHGGSFFSSWCRTYDSIARDIDDVQAEFSLPKVRPRFSGVVLNDVKNAKAYLHFSEAIQRALHSFAAELRELAFEAGDSIVEIGNMHSLAPLSQFHHHPPQRLRDSQLGTLPVEEEDVFVAHSGERLAGSRAQRDDLLKSFGDLISSGFFS